MKVYNYFGEGTQVKNLTRPYTFIGVIGVAASLKLS